MTLTFITNYLTHHTSPLSEALYGWLGAGFRFVETRPLRAGRVELGWQPEQDRPYMMTFYIRGLMAIIAEWLKGDCSDPEEHIIAVIHRCVMPHQEEA